MSLIPFSYGEPGLPISNSASDVGMKSRTSSGSAGRDPTTLAYLVILDHALFEVEARCQVTFGLDFERYRCPPMPLRTAAILSSGLGSIDSSSARLNRECFGFCHRGFILS